MPEGPSLPPHLHCDHDYHGPHETQEPCHSEMKTHEEMIGHSVVQSQLGMEKSFKDTKGRSEALGGYSIESWWTGSAARFFFSFWNTSDSVPRYDTK